MLRPIQTMLTDGQPKMSDSCNTQEPPAQLLQLPVPAIPEDSGTTRRITSTESLNKIIESTRAKLRQANDHEINDFLLSLQASCILPETAHESLSHIRYRDFVSDIRHLPASVLAYAGGVWRRQSKYFPHSSEFLSVAEPMVSRLKSDLDAFCQMRDRVQCDNPATVAKRRSAGSSAITRLKRRLKSQ